MTVLARDVLLGLGVAAAWLAAAGLIMMRRPLDRLHSSGYLSLTCGFFVVAAIVVADPLTQAALKAVLTYLALVVPGAVVTHAIGRAIHTRRESTDLS